MLSEGFSRNRVMSSSWTLSSRQCRSVHIHQGFLCVRAARVCNTTVRGFVLLMVNITLAI